MGLRKKISKAVKKVSKTVNKVSETVNKVANNPIVQAAAPVILGPAGSAVIKDVSDYSQKVSQVSEGLASGKKAKTSIAVGPSVTPSNLTVPQTAAIRPQKAGILGFLRELFGL